MQKKILVVGELNVDLILTGLTAFPSPGREVLADNLQLVMGSSSAICAAGLARLGARVDFLSKVGTDYYGDFVVEELRRLGVNTRHVIRDPVIRTGATLSLVHAGDRALVTYLGCISHLRLEDIDVSILRGYRHLHVGSYFLQRGLKDGLPELFRQAHRAGLTVSLDPGCDPEDTWGGEALLSLLEHIDIFLPNEVEARAIARTNDVEMALRELAKRARLVVVKCGLTGAISVRDDQIVRSPAFPVDVVDTTGAGDSFNAGFLYAHVVQGMPLEEALRFANACGALSTTGVGGTAAQPTFEQAMAFLEARG